MELGITLQDVEAPRFTAESFADSFNCPALEISNAAGAFLNTMKDSMLGYEHMNLDAHDDALESPLPPERLGEINGIANIIEIPHAHGDLLKPRLMKRFLKLLDL